MDYPDLASFQSGAENLANIPNSANGRGPEIDGRVSTRGDVSGSGPRANGQCYSFVEVYDSDYQIYGQVMDRVEIKGSDYHVNGQLSSARDTNDRVYISASNALAPDDDMDMNDDRNDRDSQHSSQEDTGVYDFDPDDPVDSRYELDNSQYQAGDEEEELNRGDNPFADVERNPVLLGQARTISQEWAQLLDVPASSTEDHDTDEARYCAAGVPIDSAVRHREAFDGLLSRVVGYISTQVRNSGFHDTPGICHWVNGSMWAYFRKAQPGYLTEAFLNLIPQSTRTILGYFEDPTSLLALPHITDKPGQMGVYICYVSDPNGLGALYVGSSIVDLLLLRIQQHERLMERARQDLNAKVLYQYATGAGRTYHFRQITALPACQDNAILMRLLEAVIMLALDALAPGEGNLMFTVDASMNAATKYHAL
ncbi:hypothetical protein ASPCAL08817 [Aspergillus calidoustus]|uniref:Uncharacterized protein n=1 Tax=Aspergillus calidoustus TaxID=454130 RepID=A0A0U5GXN8_ASPCI|nr:hypothetical protein ASPCAL08817 [Aspergillus calidoustus]